MIFGEVNLLSGFYVPETDELGPFAWTHGTFRVQLGRDARFVQLRLCYYGEDGTLELRSARGLLDYAALCKGWQTCAMRLDGTANGDVVEFRVSPILDVPGDSRQLGVMIRKVELFDDPRRYEMLIASGHNLRLNQREYQDGAVMLDSCPPELRINMEVRCNIPEQGQPCVYCAWDWAKDAERGSPAFTRETLEQLGDFYRSAAHVNDCSIGEPTMHKEFGSILAHIDRDGKQLSLTTNGQLLVSKRRRELLGRNVQLYVSLDSATSAGYSRYRNDRFDETIANLAALCHEKRASGNLPRVHVAFIVMRSNAEELPHFFAMMSDVGVDEIKLRCLYRDDNVDPVTVNNSQCFDYARELLTADELETVALLAKDLATAHDLTVHIEWEQFCDKMRRTGAPACSEPWTTLYVLRRGIMPCCYATEPIAAWDEQQGRPLEVFLRDVFNGSRYQELRRELAAGRLSDYCQRTPSCPIVQRMQQTGQIAPSTGGDASHAFRGSQAPDSRDVPFVPLEHLVAQCRNAA